MPGDDPALEIRGIPKTVEDLDAKMLPLLGIPAETTSTKFTEEFLQQLSLQMPDKEQWINFLRRLLTNKELAQQILSLLNDDAKSQEMRNKGITGSQEQHSPVLNQQVTLATSQNSPPLTGHTFSPSLEGDKIIDDLLGELRLQTGEDLKRESLQIFDFVKKAMDSRELKISPLSLAAISIFRAMQNLGKKLDILGLYQYLQHHGIKSRMFRNNLCQIYDLMSTMYEGKGVHNLPSNQKFPDTRTVHEAGRICYGGRSYFVDRSWAGKNLKIQQSGKILSIFDSTGQKVPYSLKVHPIPLAHKSNAVSMQSKPHKSRAQRKPAKNPQAVDESRKVDKSGRICFGGKVFYVDRLWYNQKLLVKKTGKTLSVQNAQGKVIAVSSKIVPNPSSKNNPSSIRTNHSKDRSQIPLTFNGHGFRPLDESRHVESSGRFSFKGRKFYVDPSWGGKNIRVQIEGQKIIAQSKNGEAIPVSFKAVKS